MAGWSGETLHGTLFVRSIVAVTNGVDGCTGSGLIDWRNGGSCLSRWVDPSVLSNVGRRLEAEDV
jgi:hypothetical protein